MGIKIQVNVLEKNSNVERLKAFILKYKKRCIMTALCIMIYLWGYYLLPKSYATCDSVVKYWVIADLILCIFVGVRLNISDKWKGYFAFFMLIVTPGISFYSIEYVGENKISNMRFIVVILNYLICLSVYLCIYFICNSVRASIIFGGTLFVFIALANNFVNEFRGSSIRMSDIFAIRTAMNVVGGYDFSFTEARSEILLMAVGAILLALHIEYKEKKKRGVILQRLLIIIICICLNSTALNKDYIEKNELKPDIWALTESAKMHGSLLDFVAGIPYLKVEKPKGYLEKEAEQIERAGGERESVALKTQNEIQEVRPDIVVIMNESFSNLGNLGDLELSEQPLQEFYAMEENVIRGNLSVPVLGGLTANTEFEFMTGFSNAFLPTGVMAYQNYIREGTYNFAKYLKENGYYTMFMHPFDKSGWNRNNVYKLFGFDEAYYIDDYENQEQIRGMVSDLANYREVIMRYKEAKKENEHIFLFNVTMQNHGGYETNEIEKEIQILQPEGDYPKAEEYLNLINKSDEAFQELFSFFSQQENPVIICMFGDHLPMVEDELVEKLVNSSGSSEIENNAKKYQTPFIICTNYEIEERELENVSVNYLQVLLAETAGIPLNKYQKYLESLYEMYPVINQFGVKDSEGKWYQWEEAKEFEEIKNYEMVQYMNLFSK